MTSTLKNIDIDIPIHAALLADLKQGARIKPSAWAKERGIPWQGVSSYLTKMNHEGLCECYAGTYFIRAQEKA
jgi:predicted transcriptional regulator